MKAFAERTYDEVSIDDLARAAGVSKGLLYHYFRTKRDFYVAGLREIARELLAKTLWQPQDVAPLERIRAGLDAFLDHVQGHARSFVALMRGGIGSDPEVQQIIEGVRERLVERMFTGPHSPLSVGERRTPLARTALRGWIGFAEQVTLDWLTHRDLPQTAVRDLLVDLLLPTIRMAMGFSISQKW